MHLFPVDFSAMHVKFFPYSDQGSITGFSGFRRAETIAIHNIEIIMMLISVSSQNIIFIIILIISYMYISF